MPFRMEQVAWPELSLGRFCAATAVLAIVDNLMFYPFDLLKTREHVEKTQLAGRNALAVTYQQFRDATRGRDGRHRVRGLYRGFWTASLLNIPNYIVYLGTYSYAKHVLGCDPTAETKGLATYLSPMAAGAAADLVSLGLYVPTEVVTKRVQVRDSPFSNGLAAGRHILRTEGWRGLYAGTGATLLQSGLGSGVWWSVYEAARMHLYQAEIATDRRGKSNDLGNNPREEGQEESAREIGAGPSWRLLLSGGFASLVVCVVVNPFDVARSRLQTQGAGTREYRHTYHAIQQIVKT